MEKENKKRCSFCSSEIREDTPDWIIEDGKAYFFCNGEHRLRWIQNEQNSVCNK